MKRRSLLLGAVLSVPSVWANGNIDKLRWLPEDKIEIGTAALTLAQEFRPSLDIAAYSKQLDVLAASVLSKTSASSDPNDRIQALNAVLFEEHGFRYDHDPSARLREQNYLLDGLLDSHKGTCVTLPLLYVSIAQRLGYPIFLVCVPDHSFVRYVDSKLSPINVETTSGGKLFSDDQYIRRFGVNDTALRAGSYMRALSRREHLGQLLTANAYIYGMHRNAAKSLEYLKASLLLDPRRAETYEQLSDIYDAYSKVTARSESSQYDEQAKAMMKKALSLGYVAIEDVQRTNQVRGQ